MHPKESLKVSLFWNSEQEQAKTAGYCSGNAVELYLECTIFDTWPHYWLSRLRSSMVFDSFFRRDYLDIGHGVLLPNP